MDNQKRDYQKYFIEKGDPGFNPAYNKHVIDTTIKKYEARRKAKLKQYNKEVEERVDAAVDYLFYLERGGSSTAEQYFGKKLLAHLRGEKIAKHLNPLTKELILSDKGGE